MLRYLLVKQYPKPYIQRQARIQHIFEILFKGGGLMHHVRFSRNVKIIWLNWNK